MIAILDNLALHGTGIGLALLGLFSLGLFAQWVMWLFGWGRFARRPTGMDGSYHPETPIGLGAVFFAKLISEFRHLLALVIVGLFAVALFVAMLPGLRAGNIAEIKSGVEAVAAALGGLIGSIIGYYFGESTAVRADIQSGNQAPPELRPPDSGAPQAPSSIAPAGKSEALEALVRAAEVPPADDDESAGPPESPEAGGGGSHGPV